MFLKAQQLALSTSILLLLTACGGGDNGGKDSGSGGSDDLVGKVIADIDEASGICYSAARDSLFVVSDKGVIYELDTDGQEKAKATHRTNKDKKYDYEGVACDDANGRVVVAVEGKDNLHSIDQDDLTSMALTAADKPTGDIERPDDGTLFKDEKGKTGIEGIAILDGSVYISNQSLVKYPGQDSSFVFTVDDYSADNPIVIVDEVIDHGFLDIVGLSFYKGNLFMVSAENHKLIEYDINNMQEVAVRELPKDVAAEGVTFDDAGNIYFADDKSGKVYKFKASDLGIN